MKTRTIYNTLMCMLLITFFTACDKDAHENEYLLPEGKGALIIGFEQNTEDITIEDLTIYLFGEDGQTEFCQTYTDPRELASEHIALDAGNYTLLAVANSEGKNSNETKTEALPQETTLPDLAEWLSEHAADFPNLMTASTQTEVKTGVANRLLLQLQKGTEGIHLSTLALRLTLPEPDMPAYTSTRAKDGENTPLLLDAGSVQEGYRKGIVRTCLCGCDPSHQFRLHYARCDRKNGERCRRTGNETLLGNHAERCRCLP